MHEVIKQILTDAVEGPAIAYWARCYRSVREHTGKYKLVTQFRVSDAAPDGGKPVKKGSKTIGERAILKARDLLVNGNVNVRRDIKAQFVGQPDAWEYDQEGIDALVQLAFFGELVYG